MASLTSDDVAPIDMMNRPTTNMEKIQFITSYGIRRRSLRYCIHYLVCCRKVLFCSVFLVTRCLVGYSLIVGELVGRP